jgi:hypothetical protein
MAARPAGQPRTARGSSMASVYEGQGIRFEYPESWQIDPSQSADEVHSVSVYSPGGAFWTVALHSVDVDPQSVLEAALTAMRETYQDLDAEPVQESIDEVELPGYDINFYCLDMTNTARARCLQTQRGTYLLFCQAEDREFAQIEQVFQAITQSLLSAITDEQ